MSVAEAGELTSPLPVPQMNPFMLRYMDFTAIDAFQQASQRHRISIQEHYASIFLADRLPVPDRYLADMELSLTNVALRSSIGRLGLYVNVPLLRPTAGWMDRYIKAYHKFFNFPDAGRELRPNNQYAYMLTGAWNSRPQWELGNISAGLQYPVMRSEHDALALLAGGKIPTADRQRGWGSGTWDGGIGFVDSFRAQPFFAHIEAWYMKPFGRDHVPFIRNRAYARASLAIGWEGRFFRPLGVSNRLFSFIIQSQGGMSPYDNTGMPALDQNPWLIAFGLRWQDSRQRDWLISFTENITQQSTQDFGIGIACAFD